MSASGNQILDNLRYATTRLSVVNYKGEGHVGTGFFFVIRINEKTSYPLLITNKHMICNGNNEEDWKTLSFKVNRADNQGNPLFGNVEQIEIQNTLDTIRFIHPDVDLCAFSFGGYLNNFDAKGIKICFKYFPEELIPNADDMPVICSIEDILMVGYPDGMADENNNLPIVRRGITATDFKIDYNGRKEFLIDASIFKGSSGSPIVICNIGSYNNAEGKLCLGNRVFFLGIQYRGQFSKFQENIYIRDDKGVLHNASNIISAYFNDLGFCVKSECLMYFKDEILRQWKEETEKKRNIAETCGTPKYSKNEGR